MRRRISKKAVSLLLLALTALSFGAMGGTPIKVVYHMDDARAGDRFRKYQGSARCQRRQHADDKRVDMVQRQRQQHPVVGTDQPLSD